MRLQNALNPPNTHLRVDIGKELALACAVAGLLLSYFFSPVNSYLPETVLEASRACSGLVKVDATASKVFFSQKANLIGILSEGNASLLVLLNDFPVVEGNVATFYARAQKQGKSCWLFPKRVVVND